MTSLIIPFAPYQVFDHSGNTTSVCYDLRLHSRLYHLHMLQFMTTLKVSFAHVPNQLCNSQNIILSHFLCTDTKYPEQWVLIDLVHFHQMCYRFSRYLWSHFVSYRSSSCSLDFGWFQSYQLWNNLAFTQCQAFVVFFKKEKNTYKSYTIPLPLNWLTNISFSCFTMQNIVTFWKTLGGKLGSVIRLLLWGK